MKFAMRKGDCLACRNSTAHGATHFYIYFGNGMFPWSLLIPIWRKGLPNTQPTWSALRMFQADVRTITHSFIFAPPNWMSLHKSCRKWSRYYHLLYLSDGSCHSISPVYWAPLQCKRSYIIVDFLHVLLYIFFFCCLLVMFLWILLTSFITSSR